MAYTTVNKSTDYFNTKLYTGNGSTQSITGVGFQPDWLWIKNRSTTENHFLQDAVRGSTKRLNSNNSNAEATEADGVTAFASDGFNVGYTTEVNGNGNNLVSWNWKANGTGSSNSNGSVTSTVSANTTAGFSVCKFTYPSSGNFTFGHGLGVAPKMFILKGLGSANWQVYHESLGNTYNTQLNYTNATSSAANWWGSTSPTNTVCTVGADLIESGQDAIAYCFAEKIGYSKFGSYRGNGNADGTFIYTGFRPAFTMVKRTDGTGDWIVMDNKRSPFNLTDNRLIPNSSGAEQTSGNSIDILSNGFKNRTSDGYNNASGGTYIYMSFGQSLVGSNNIVATAR